jgi:hypothetical protein
MSQFSTTVTKYLRNSTFKQERLILAYSFRSFISWLLDPIAFQPTARQYIMAGTCGKGRYLPHGI